MKFYYTGKHQTKRCKAMLQCAQCNAVLWTLDLADKPVPHVFLPSCYHATCLLCFEALAKAGDGASVTCCLCNETQHITPEAVEGQTSSRGTDKDVDPLPVFRRKRRKRLTNVGVRKLWVRHLENLETFSALWIHTAEEISGKLLAFQIPLRDAGMIMETSGAKGLSYKQMFKNLDALRCKLERLRCVFGKGWQQSGCLFEKFMREVCNCVDRILNSVSKFAERLDEDENRLAVLKCADIFIPRLSEMVLQSASFASSKCYDVATSAGEVMIGQMDAMVAGGDCFAKNLRCVPLPPGLDFTDKWHFTFESMDEVKKMLGVVLETSKIGNFICRAEVWIGGQLFDATPEGSSDAEYLEMWREVTNMSKYKEHVAPDKRTLESE